MRLWLAAAAVSLCGSAASAQSLTNAAERPPAGPLASSMEGVTLDDDAYRWMESAERAAEVEAFIRRSSAHTTAQLASLPGRARLRERIAAAYQAGRRYGDLQLGRGAVFYRRTDPDAQLAKLVVRMADGTERILYDPEAGGTRGPAINNYSVSPDGRTVALHTAAGGAEVGAIRFIDVAGGRTLADTLEPVWGEFEAIWLDDRTVAYTRMTGADSGAGDRLQNMRLFVHRIGGGDSQPLLGRDVAGSPAFLGQEFPLVVASEHSDWVIGLGVGARADARIFVARRADLAAGRPQWRVIADYSDEVAGAAVAGDTLFLRSTRNAPNGTILTIDLARGGDLASAATLMPPGEAILTAMAATEDGLYVTGQTDGISRLFFLAGGSGAPVEVALPMQGLLAGMSPRAGGPGVSFGMVDWFTAARWFAADGTTITPLGFDSASYQGVAGATQIRETAISADGTRVPMAILLPAQRGSGPLPLLLEGYGSYGVNTAEPYYAQGMFGLLESGGAVAYCGTRGGGERGRAWHEAGRSANKPNAHADLIACGERLVELGLTAPERMTVIGTSAGGLLAPVAALRRPDLFGALVANVAILNPTRLAAAENGPNQYAEMGDPDTEEGMRALRLSDAYQLVMTADDMPDTLLTVGLNDRRVDPWMSAKFAARALGRFGATRLVLIRTDPEAGHGIGSARDQTVEQWADIFAFVLYQAGAEGFAAPR